MHSAVLALSSYSYFKNTLGTSPITPLVPSAEDLGSIPGQETKILHATTKSFHATAKCSHVTKTWLLLLLLLNHFSRVRLCATP